MNTPWRVPPMGATQFRLDDDDLDDEDDEDEDKFDEDDEDDDGDDEDDEDEDEPETWQVGAGECPLSAGSPLTSRIELPRLPEVFQLY